MQVILLEKISNLGDLGSKVRVKPGFGRNFLIPQGKALPATAANLEKFEARRAELEKAAIARLAKAEEQAAKLQGLKVSIAAQAGEEGRLFGSIGASDIVRAIKEAGHMIHKSDVRLPTGPMRQVGEYEIVLQLQGNEVTATVMVSIIAE